MGLFLGLCTQGTLREAPTFSERKFPEIQGDSDSDSGPIVQLSGGSFSGGAYSGRLHSMESYQWSWYHKRYSSMVVELLQRKLGRHASQGSQAISVVKCRLHQEQSGITSTALVAVPVLQDVQSNGNSLS